VSHIIFTICHSKLGSMVGIWPSLWSRQRQNHTGIFRDSTWTLLLTVWKLKAPEQAEYSMLEMIRMLIRVGKGKAGKSAVVSTDNKTLYYPQRHHFVSSPRNIHNHRLLSKEMCLQ
jgi:hypothetical protein